MNRKMCGLHWCGIGIAVFLISAAAGTAGAYHGSRGLEVAGDVPHPAAGRQLAESARTLAPGTDITQAIADAPNGAIIVLDAGEYPGIIAIKGKSLTIEGDPGGQTVLTGSKNQMIVYVSGKGKLKLGHVTFRTRAEDGLAVYVKDATAVIHDCRVTATMQPAFYADNAHLEIQRCSLKELNNSGVFGVNRATIAVRDSTLSGSPKGGVVVSKGSTGEVTGTRFEGIARAGVKATDNASVAVRDSHFAASVGWGVVVDRNSVGEVTRSRFENLGNVAVLGLNGARVTVADSTFENIKDTAIHSEGGGGLEVRGSRFTNVKGAVAAVKGDITVSLHDNSIANVTGEGYALVSESSGKVTISGNRIVKAAKGIRVAGKLKSTAQISGNTVIGVEGRGLSLRAALAGGGVGAEVSGNRILGSGGNGVLVHESPKVTLTGNLILSRGDYGIFVQKGSSVQFDGNIIAGAKGGLFVHSSAAKGSSAGADIFIGGVKPKDAVKRSYASTQVAFLSAGKETQARLKAKTDAVLATAAAGDPVNIEAAAAALAEEGKTIRASARSLAAIELKTVDAIGTQFFSEFTIYDSSGNVASKNDAHTQVAIVPPGTYIVEPSFDTSLARDATVATGETKVIDVTAKNRLVVNFDNQVEVTFPLALKSRRAMGRALRAHRIVFPAALVAVPRPEATEANRDRALILARAALAAQGSEVLAVSRQIAPLEKKSYQERTEAENEAFSTLSGKRNTLAGDFLLPAKILTAFGDEADAKRLVDEAAAASSLMEFRVAVAASIENRLGILGAGAVAAALEGQNRELALWAAILLHYHGHDGGDAVLVENLLNPTGSRVTGLAARVLLDTPRADVLAAMRGIVDITLKARIEKKYNEATGDAKIPAALYLLAHGGIDDWKRVARLSMSTNYVTLMTMATTDPQPLIDFLKDNMFETPSNFAKYEIGQWSEMFTDLCPMFRNLPSRNRAQMEKAIERAFVSVGVKFNVSGRTRKSDKLSSRAYHGADVSSCRATGAAARIVFKKMEVFFRHKDWIPTPWASANQLKGKGYWSTSDLDYVAHETVAEGIRKHHPRDDGKRDLFLAYHAVATGAELQIGDTLPGGADRRAFVLINRTDPPGALAAVVAMRPELIDDILRVTVAFDLASHTEASLATLMDPPERSFQHYLSTRGKGLIRKLYLRQGSKTIPMSATKDDGSGKFVYQAKLEQRTLAETTLHVDLQIFDQAWPLTFGLYASDYARKLNRATTRLAAAAKAATAQPDDARTLTIWANALQAAGRLDEARDGYEKALALRPKDVDLRFALSDMYARRGLYDQSVEALKKAVAALPENPDFRFELANDLYRGGDYSEAADAFGKLSAMEPAEVRWKWWRATNQFLAGDRRAAAAFLGRATTKYQGRRTALLSFIAAKLDGSPEDLAAAQAKLKEMLKGRESTAEGNLYSLYMGTISVPQVFKDTRTPAQQCQAHLYVGYNRLMAGKTNEAHERLTSALEVCGANKLEYRLAEAELGRLGKAP